MPIFNKIATLKSNEKRQKEKEILNPWTKPSLAQILSLDNGTSQMINWDVSLWHKGFALKKKKKNPLKMP